MFHCDDRPDFTRRRPSGACGHSTNEEKTTATTTASSGGKEERDYNWRREEGVTDVTLVDKSGTLERKGEGEYLGKEVSIKEFGNKEFRRPARRDKSRSLGRRDRSQVGRDRSPVRRDKSLARRVRSRSRKDRSTARKEKERWRFVACSNVSWIVLSEWVWPDTTTRTDEKYCRFSDVPWYYSRQ